MKRSKLLLSATTCVLAIVAFAHARAHKNNISFCTTVSGNVRANDLACSTIHSSNLSSPLQTCTSNGFKLATCNSSTHKTVYKSSVE